MRRDIDVEDRVFESHAKSFNLATVQKSALYWPSSKATLTL